MGKGFDKKARLCYSKRVHGEMPEWSKGAVLKTVDARASVGSNPILSAKTKTLAITRKVSDCKGFAYVGSMRSEYMRHTK